jgi:integrase
MELSGSAPKVTPFVVTSKKERTKIGKSMGGYFPMSSVKQNVQALIEDSRAASTKKIYKGNWEYFEKWCSWVNMRPFPATVSTVITFASWYEMTGRGASVAKVLAAITAVHEDRGVISPVRDTRVQKLLKGAARRAAEDKDFVPERDPLPVKALHEWIFRKPVGLSEKIWKRNGAILALGLRCMRRPVELTWLKRRDVKGWKNGLLWIRIPKSKTDQFGKGKLVPIDRVSGSRTCPAKIVWDYFCQNKDQPANAYLFLSVRGKQLSAAAVSSIVKKAARHAGLDGRYTGHSLRIGGVTAAVTGGLTMAQLRGIGDWESNAVRYYLRALSAATTRASSKMGF